MPAPQLTVIAGPNGAGKSTSAPALLKRGTPYLNADEIARMLPGPGSDIQAGRLLLETWNTLASQRASFAIETTLASRSLAGRIEGAKALGYQVTIYFLWLPSPELAIARVKQRVRLGGHSVHSSIVRRRHASGIENFVTIYRPLADAWVFYGNGQINGPARIANGSVNNGLIVFDGGTWKLVDPDAATVESITASPNAVDRRLREATRKALLQHKRKGNQVCEWRNGKVRWVTP